eukprot:4682758-Pleurochrysis_carterae.AAC.2
MCALTKQLRRGQEPPLRGTSRRMGTRRMVKGAGSREKKCRPWRSTLGFGSHAQLCNRRPSNTLAATYAIQHRLSSHEKADQKL